MKISQFDCRKSGTGFKLPNKLYNFPNSGSVSEESMVPDQIMKI